MSDEMRGLNVIVTGAASGIGHSIAEILHGRGANVIGWDIDASVSSSMKALGSAGSVVDVSNRVLVDDAVAMAERSSNIGALVNCAGIVRRNSFVNMTPEEFELLWRVNVLGVLYPSQAVARSMIEAGTAGAIVNLASVAAEHVGASSSGYAATKGAVVSLTRGAAVSLAPYGIRVNAVMPGPIETPMNAVLREDPAQLSAMLSRIPLARQGDASDVAEAAAYLMSERASWITGEVLRVDGGVSVMR